MKALGTIQMERLNENFQNCNHREVVESRVMHNDNVRAAGRRGVEYLVRGGMRGTIGEGKVYITLIPCQRLELEVLSMHRCPDIWECEFLLPCRGKR